MLLKNVKAGERYQAIWSSPLTFATVEVVEIGLERRDCTGEMQNDGLNCQIIDLRIDSRSKGSSEFTAGDEILLTSQQLDVDVMDFIHIFCKEKISYKGIPADETSASGALEKVLGIKE